MASDIAVRLRELLTICGWNQMQMAGRAGVRPAQVGMWLAETQRPAKSRLAAWARREGWPVEIFAEGGPMPSTLVNRRSEARPPGAPARMGAGRRREDIELRAESKRKDAARLDVIGRLIRAYRDAGHAPGPGTLDEWLEILAGNGEEPTPPAGAPVPPESGQ